MNKQLIDYARKIEGGSEEILNSDSRLEDTNDATGSNISITRVVYKFKDGVSIEYKREHDDGSPYPGCQTFFYTYKVINANNFTFDGETIMIFDSKSELQNWLNSAL